MVREKPAEILAQHWNGGGYVTQQVARLKAFARVYAGRAFSQTFYRDGRYWHLGHADPAALLQHWEADQVRDWDANNLLAKPATGQAADISAGPVYQGDFSAALTAITAHAILMLCTQGLYFTPEDNAIEARVMPRAKLRPYDSPWGHCAASPGNETGFTAHLDAALGELLEHTYIA